MKSRIFKFILYSFLSILFIIILWVTGPRLWSALTPGQPPMGYYWMAPGYVALWLGLEKQVDLKPAIPDDIEEIKDIEYKNINGKSLQLDIYRPVNSDKPVPLLVFIHGGAWKSGQRSDYLVYLLAFAKKGYMTATVSYRLLKDGPYPACAEDITDAVAWLFRNGDTYGYDPDRIALIGGSAGAHLAMLAAYGWKGSRLNPDSSEFQPSGHRIKAVVDIYGPVDFTTEYARNHPLITSFMARSFEEAPEIYTEASPDHYLSRDDPPTLILQGTADELLPPSQSDNLKKKLDELGVPCVYYRLPGWPHAMDVVQRVNDFCQEKMTGFFEQFLLP